MSSFLLGAPPAGGDAQAPPGLASAPHAPPAAPAGGAGRQSHTLTLIAGVGVLLLAMGVGVLIGRSGPSGHSAPPAEVVTVAGAAGTGTAPAAGGASFTGDWPAGTSGFTVQLRTLPLAGTAVSAAEAAKTVATGKGAKGVGALKSEEFSSLTAGSYVIYSGVYRKKDEAEKALRSLKKSFPGASVIKVSNGSSSSGAGSGSGSGSGVGSTPNNPAPPSVLEGLKGSGKSYEEKSKNLPNVVSTG
jgi:hypothetical protein